MSCRRRDCSAVRSGSPVRSRPQSILLRACWAELSGERMPLTALGSWSQIVFFRSRVMERHPRLPNRRSQPDANRGRPGFSFVLAKRSSTMHQH